MLVKNFDHLLELVKHKRKMKIAVVVAEDLEVLKVVSKAEEMELAEFILLGDTTKIKKIINENKLSVSAEMIDEKDHKQASEKAVDMIVSGEVDTIKKGMLHTDIFMKAILDKKKGLNTGKRISHVAVIEKENKDGLLMITDCGITIDPDLMAKKMILENAVELAHKLGYEKPKVAVLASTEVINPAMQDTVDAAVLSKMSERGQIKGCIVEGPLALDNAISMESAERKGIKGAVAGNADIIVVPQVTVGNTLSKAITFIAKKQVLSVLMGVAIPVVITSRTESMDGKILTIAMANYLS
ncbi:MAG: bifunctional enoyl-CoA hydratase/phosphate acetyltransferase [Desulfosporosinus sp.]